MQQQPTKLKISNALLNDPLFTRTHAAPPTQLKQKTWQHVSDEIFQRANMDPAHQSFLSISTAYLPHSTFTLPNIIKSNPPISLENLQPLVFTSKIAPWTIFRPNIKFFS